jgi:hypothetical protein
MTLALKVCHLIVNTGQAYNDHMDALMELDRVTDIQRREEEEKQKLARRVRDREVSVEPTKANDACQRTQAPICR